ncbi:DoxX family membrane protein [Solihabitans fulvus]|uniref:DoxX family membrane protein n=1 Tax=Solihabitans fulvus TaxID=1892852 RepID=A0A5B2WWW0_9PSEU|nr:DoxX family membrane protein [Solihabitans fulvus]KAA2256141.1 DoxX family membrane protein [Solihabitans fulvus]
MSPIVLSGPRTRRNTVRALWFALAAQSLWFALNGLVLHRAPGLDAFGVAVTVLFAVFAALRDRWSWLSVLVRLLMAAEFLLAVCDRFGVFGAPGAAGVSWGDFAHFVDYTRSMTTFLPGGLAWPLAVAATVAELGLGLALLLGLRTRLAAQAAAGLLAVYGVSMTISLPAAEQFHYVVFVLCGGMLVLATLDRVPFGVDALAARAALV